MRQVVTVVLVARNGAEYLDRTIAALKAQTRQPDVFIAVSARSSDNGADQLAAAQPAQLVSAPAKSSFGDAIALGMHGVPHPDSDNEWLWFLAHDNAPEPRALQQLLAAVEIAPSVGIAGPKLMRWDKPDTIAEFGESMTRLGASMPMVENELDQAQHDVSDDVLGVAAQGMLVRRSLWSKLGGFDPGLPTVDSGLDFSIRARLAGFRVVLVPGARVASAGGPELFGRKSVSAAKRTAAIRSAQLHRRLVYAPGAAMAVHWLSLVPLAVLRSLGALLAKRPGAIAGEFSAAFRAAFDGAVAGARRNLHRTRTLGWGAIAPLRLPWSDVRERRAQAREEQTVSTGHTTEPKISFISGGGLAVVAVAAVAGLIAFGPLLGASAVSGGGLLPLDADIRSLWSKVGVGWREIGTGFLGAADPLTTVLAVLGSLTFWAPSLSIVILYFAALPLAATGAWFAARRLSVRGWIPAIAAVLWAVAPPFLSSLSSGQLGSAIAHILLPWLALALINASRSWPAAAAAALLMAAVTASAPVLAPVIVLAWLAWMVVQPRGLHRLILIPLPAAALFAPLVIEQFRRGNLLALLADPGVPADGGGASAWQLALASTDGGLSGWVHLLDQLSLPVVAAPYVVAALLAVPVVLALMALFLPGTRRAVPGLVLALLGFLVAVASSRLELSSVGADTTAVWTGSGLSLFWLGLLCCVIAALDALGPASLTLGTVAVATTVLLAAPLLIAGYVGAAAIAPSSNRIVPAVVAAESVTNPQIGTLMLKPASSDTGEDDRISATLHRGLGTTLDDQSTIAATDQQLGEVDDRLATLAGNLASRSGYDPTADLEDLYIGFVVLEDDDRGDKSQAAVHKRITVALDGNDRVSSVGETASGLLWRVATPPETVPEAQPGNTDTPFGVIVLTVQGVIVFLTLLLAVPTARRKRRVRASANSLEGPATTFDEEDNA
ncbi:glycosyltransferase family 2 protein [Homoserinimonas sp. A447]